VHSLWCDLGSYFGVSLYVVDNKGVGGINILAWVCLGTVALAAKSKIHKKKIENYTKPMSTLTKLSGSLRKAKAIQGTATTSQEKRKSQVIVSRLKRAVQKARKKYYRESFGY